jgi:hypothetical protein
LDFAGFAGAALAEKPARREAGQSRQRNSDGRGGNGDCGGLKFKNNNRERK